MQGGQGDIKHWAFNDPLRREGALRRHPTEPGRNTASSATRVVELHPITLAQNARTSGGGNITMVPQRAITVGPLETWKAEKVSIWQAGTHDNPLGPEADRADDLEGDRRLSSADVAAGGSPECAVQLLPRRPRELLRGDALAP